MEIAVFLAEIKVKPLISIYIFGSNPIAPSLDGSRIGLIFNVAVQQTQKPQGR
jgi:hypothetical protein